MDANRTPQHHYSIDAQRHKYISTTRHMILFIHGFGSCGWGEKSLLLRRHFGLPQVLAPDLPFRPTAAIDHLRGMLQRYPINVLVGSSLGGFYATCLNAYSSIPTVLINPVVNPHCLLQGYLGHHHRWCDGAPFDVKAAYLEDLIALNRSDLNAEEQYLVLLQTGDETLDYRQAAAYYRDKTVITIAGGSHRFDHLDAHLGTIADWLDSPMH